MGACTRSRIVRYTTKESVKSTNLEKFLVSMERPETRDGSLIRFLRYRSELRLKRHRRIQEMFMT